MTALISMVLALLSIFPRVFSPSKITPENIRKDRVSVLFFGVADELSPEEFEALFLEVLSDETRARQHTIRALHGIGKRIKYKYRMIQAAYICLMLGLTIIICGGQMKVVAGTDLAGCFVRVTDTGPPMDRRRVFSIMDSRGIGRMTACPSLVGNSDSGESPGIWREQPEDGELENA